VVLRESNENDALQAAVAMQRGKVVDLSAPLAIAASKLSLEYNLPVADSIILEYPCPSPGAGRVMTFQALPAGCVVQASVGFPCRFKSREKPFFSDASMKNESPDQSVTLLRSGLLL
jgi:hypothetical protein